MFRVKCKNTRTNRCGVSIVNCEHISHLFSSVSIIDFEQENVCWEALTFQWANTIQN